MTGLASAIVENIKKYGEVPIGFLSHITNTEINKINEILEELKVRKVVTVHNKTVKLNEGD